MALDTARALKLDAREFVEGLWNKMPIPLGMGGFLSRSIALHRLQARPSVPPFLRSSVLPPLGLSDRGKRPCRRIARSLL